MTKKTNPFQRHMQRDVRIVVCGYLDDDFTASDKEVTIVRGRLIGSSSGYIHLENATYGENEADGGVDLTIDNDYVKSVESTPPQRSKSK